MTRSRCSLRVAGLDCPNEVAAIESALASHPGIETLSFDLIHGVLTVDYDADLTDPERMAGRILSHAGLRATLAGAPQPATSWWARRGRIVLTAGSGVALACALIFDWFGARLGLGAPADHRAALAAYGLAILIGGMDLLPRALRSVRGLRLNIDVLMTLAVIAAACLGDWNEAATVAFLYGLSETLEALSLEHARRTVRALLDVAPSRAERLNPDGSIAEVPASTIARGDRLLVRAGETIPVDGVIAVGRSSIDEKALTGESVPVARGVGDPIHAGTINGEGTLEMIADGPVSESVVARVIDQVRSARSGRAVVERRIDRFAAFYTPAVLALAILVALAPLALTLAQDSAAVDRALVRQWGERGLVILVIACPCALVIATPVAVVSGLAAAARRGVLVRGGEYLERVGRLTVMAFDKTGTLTSGRPDVVEVVPTHGSGGKDRLLSIAAALGDRGGHVLGKAIARHARDLRISVPVADDYRAVPGLGALGRVETVEYHLGSHRYIDEIGMCGPGFHDQLGQAEESVGSAVAVSAPSGPLGYIRLADQVRPEASRVIAELQALGLRTVMLTGDNARTAAAVAGELGVHEQRAGLSPEDKVKALSEIDAEHGMTGMVGDGVNDAPALAAARVSIAIGGASSGAALESADVILLAEDLGRLPWLVRHGRKVLGRIHQNIAIALVLKGAVLVAAVLGLANLWMAVASDVGASLVVVANALRLLHDSES